MLWFLHAPLAEQMTEETENRINLEDKSNQATSDMAENQEQKQDETQAQSKEGGGSMAIQHVASYN